MRYKSNNVEFKFPFVDVIIIDSSVLIPLLKSKQWKKMLHFLNNRDFLLLFPQSLARRDIPVKYQTLKNWLIDHGNLVNIRRQTDEWQLIYHHGTNAYNGNFHPNERFDIDLLALAWEQARCNKRVFVVSNDEGILDVIKNAPYTWRKFPNKVRGWIGGAFFAFLEAHYHYRYPKECTWFAEAMENVTKEYIKHRENTREDDSLSEFMRNQYHEAILNFMEVQNKLPPTGLELNERQALIQWYFDWSNQSFNSLVRRVGSYTKKGITLPKEDFKDLLVDWNGGKTVTFMEEASEQLNLEENDAAIYDYMSAVSRDQRRMIYDPRNSEMPPVYILKLMNIELLVAGKSYVKRNLSQLTAFYKTILRGKSKISKFQSLINTWQNQLQTYRYRFDTHLTLPIRKRERYFEFICQPAKKYTKSKLSEQETPPPPHEMLTSCTDLNPNQVKYCPDCAKRSMSLKEEIESSFLDVKRDILSYITANGDVPRAKKFPKIVNTISSTDQPEWIRYYKIFDWNALLYMVIGNYKRVIKKSRLRRRG